MEEAVLDAGIRLEIVLPFDTDEFEAVSVAPARRELGGAIPIVPTRRAASVVHASDSSFMHDDELFGYAARIAIGHTLNRAAFLDRAGRAAGDLGRRSGRGRTRELRTTSRSGARPATRRT